MWNVLSFAGVKEIVLVLLGVLLVAGGVYGYRAWKLSRITPEERERRRRCGLVARGKMGDATITEIRGELLFYSYNVRGVEYIASQDLSQLMQYLPPICRSWSARFRCGTTRKTRQTPSCSPRIGVGCASRRLRKKSKVKEPKSKSSCGHRRCWAVRYDEVNQP